MGSSPSNPKEGKIKKKETIFWPEICFFIFSSYQIKKMDLRGVSNDHTNCVPIVMPIVSLNSFCYCFPIEYERQQFSMHSCRTSD